MHVRTTVWRTALFAVCALLSTARPSAAFNVRVAWQPVSGVDGYHLYVRLTGTSYGAGLDVGKPSADADGVIRYIASGLTQAADTYFVVTSYTGMGESPPSNEILVPYAETAPLVDTDGDGLTDAAEDRDLDGVKEPTETDRLRADTDGDGINDGAEVANGTNPLDPADPPASGGACARALTIPAAGGTFVGVTSGTGTLSGSCAPASTAPEQVFSWTPATSGFAVLETCSATGTGFDTVLYVRRSACATGTELACNDDAASCVTAEPNDHHGSRVQPFVNAGETYFIVVDGYTGAGAFTLHVAAPSSATPTASAATPSAVATRTATAVLATATVTAAPTAPQTTTPAPTMTRTATVAPTPTGTATRTATPTAIASPLGTGAALVATASRTPTPGRTPSATTTPPSATPTRTATFTVAPTATATATRTTTPIPTSTATRTATPTPTATRAATPTSTTTATATPTATRTAIPTSTSTATPTPTATRAATPTSTTTATATATATRAATPTSTTTATATPTATRTATPTSTTTATATPTATGTPTETATPTPTGTATPTPMPTGACAFPSPIPANGGTFSGTNPARAGNVAGSCASTQASSESVFQWTPAVSGTARIETCSKSATTFDTVLYVRGDSCFGGTELACNDDSGGCQTAGGGRPHGSRLSLDVSAGQTYFIVVDGGDGASGDFLLTVRPPSGKSVRTSAETTIAGRSATGAVGAVDRTSPSTNDAAAAIPAATYRCRRATADDTDDAENSPPPIHFIDRFGALAADVGSLRALCAPSSDVTDASGASEPSLARYATSGAEGGTVARGALHLRNVLGDVDVQVAMVDGIATAAATSTLDGTDNEPAAAPTGDPQGCYRVRARSGSQHRSLALAAPSEVYRLSRPTRLCTIDRPGGNDTATVALCYRAHPNGPTPSAQPAEDAPLAITSRFGITVTTLGDVDEICVPSEVVPGDAP